MSPLKFAQFQLVRKLPTQFELHPTQQLPQIREYDTMRNGEALSQEYKPESTKIV
jgi:hypothetical protein